MTEGNVAVYEGHPMTLAGRPADILEEAKVAASALMTVVEKAGLSINFGGKKNHLEFEAWQTLGKFYGLTSKCTSTNFVQFGSVQGFESVSVVIDRYGEEISRAEAMCLNDEDNWKSKTKYGYLYVLKDGSKQEEDPGVNQMVWIDNPSKPGKKMPKREKVKMGEEAVPLFQLKSMAQTRSNAKALRNVLAWIVVLAGYAPTPAEEMTGKETAHEKEPERQMKAPEEKKAEPAATDGSPDVISDNQKRAVFAICTKLGIKDDKVKHDYIGMEILGMAEGIKSVNDLTKAQATTVIKFLNEKQETKEKVTA